MTKSFPLMKFLIVHNAWLSSATASEQGGLGGYLGLAFRTETQKSTVYRWCHATPTVNAIKTEDAAHP